MDYNIKFEYKGLGKGIQGARQKAIQQSRKLSESGISPVTAMPGKKKDVSSATYAKLNSSITKLIASNEKLSRVPERKEKDVPVSGKSFKSKKTDSGQEIQDILKPKKKSATEILPDKNINIAPISKLNSSIVKLIASNEKLTKAVNSSKGVGNKPIGGDDGGGLGGGMGKAGASIPFVGALLAVGGIAVQKINQIGNAYIEKASEQLQNVGVSGFRTKGAGVYTASQISGGMGAYARTTGQFTPAKESPSAMALKIGAIHGLSAEETLRTAGQFRRAGANYGQAAAVAAGTGIQSDLPLLLTGMADTLTEAVKEGINTSDMAKDMAEEIAGLAMTTPGKSVEAALNMINNFKGVMQGITRGKVQSAQQLYATGATQQMLMRRVSGEDLQDLGLGGEEALRSGYITKVQASKISAENYAKNLEKQGFINKEEVEKLRKFKPGDDFSKLQQAIPGLAMPLMRKFGAEANQAEILKETYKLAGKSFGTETAEGRRRFYDTTLGQGWTESQAQQERIFQYINNPTPESAAKLEKQGIDLTEERYKGVMGSEAGMSTKKIQMQEDLMYKYGEKFAELTMKMNEGMFKIAEKAAPTLNDALIKLGVGADNLNTGLNILGVGLKKVTDVIKGWDKKLMDKTNSIFVPAGN
jgi:hypothetical protein